MRVEKEVNYKTIYIADDGKKRFNSEQDCLDYERVMSKFEGKVTDIENWDGSTTLCAYVGGYEDIVDFQTYLRYQNIYARIPLNAKETLLNGVVCVDCTFYDDCAIESANSQLETLKEHIASLTTSVNILEKMIGVNDESNIP